MIIDKQPFPDDPTPADAPPSYETLGASSSTRDHKARLVEPEAGSSRSLLPSPTSPSLSKSPSSYSSSATYSSPGSAAKGKGKEANWFKFTKSPEERRAEQVEKTVLDLVRSLIEEHNSSSSAASDILQSCANACGSSLSLTTLLQKKSMENHTPFYWAIVKRLPDEHQDVADQHGPDLLSALISYALPLTKETITDIRLACLATSDQVLFQRLRLSPEFAPLSGTDQLLLGMTVHSEEIVVEDLPGDEGAFKVDMVIPHFHKRMVVTKEIAIEFIARSRLWCLTFYVATEPNIYSSTHTPTGSWCISLALLETSPPAYVTSRLVIDVVKPLNPRPPSPPSPTRNGRGALRIKEKQRPISIGIQSREQVQPRSGRQQDNKIVVVLEDKTSGAGLQYGNNAYIASDEKLRARFEARLEKPADDADCIIC